MSLGNQVFYSSLPSLFLAREMGRMHLLGSSSIIGHWYLLSQTFAAVIGRVNIRRCWGIIDRATDHAHITFAEPGLANDLASRGAGCRCR